MWYWIAIAMTIVANLTYTLCAKVTAPIHPLAALTVTYAVSLICCVALYPVFDNGSSLWTQIREANASSYILGAALVLLESGFILAYRFGWNLSQASLFSNATVTLFLIPISYFFFHETVTWTKGLGMLLAMLGLALMVF